MDAIQPVAAEINPPSMQQGLGTLSSILGLSQQQLQIQQQKQALQGQQAQVQQQQQQNSEMQQAQGILQQVHTGGYRNSDGSLNRQQLSDDLDSLGPYATQYGSTLLSQANEIVANQQAHQSLSESQQKQVGSTFASLASKPDLSPSDVIDAFQTLEGQNPDPQFHRMLLSMATHLPPNATPQQLQGIMQRWSAASTGEPVQQPSSVNTGAAVVPGGTNRFTGAFSPSGSNVPMQLTPGQQLPQPVTNSAGQLLNRNPVSGAISLPPQGQGPQFNQASINPTPGAPPQPPQNLNPTSAQVSGQTGAAGIDVSRANQVSASVQPSSAGIQLSQSADDLADQIHSGKFVASISQAAAAVGMSSSTYARQLLAKDLGQLKTLAIKNAPSDAAAGTIQSGYPEVTSDPQTLHTAMDYIRGSLRQNVARGQLLSTYRQSHPDLTGFQNADDAYTSTVNPLMAEFKSLTTPQQRIGFYQRNFKSPAEALAFKNQVQGASGGP